MEKMTSKECQAQLSKVLFWDVDESQFDMDAHATFIIPRVLEHGDFNDWRIILHYYGLGTIVDVCKHVRTLEPTCLSFICTISDTKKEDYRCYHFRQSNPTLWNS